ncbi:hypothetical protein AB5J55_36585 [Streptomyces sp. R11]|uniref:Uncharacterized protein n=1 Tax=Streptomyces sp. R11 TaxID=3238625 RepID=A0AB39N838_9ACTN
MSEITYVRGDATVVLGMLVKMIAPRGRGELRDQPRTTRRHPLS